MPTCLHCLLIACLAQRLAFGTCYKESPKMAGQRSDVWVLPAVPSSDEPVMLGVCGLTVRLLITQMGL